MAKSRRRRVMVFTLAAYGLPALGLVPGLPAARASLDHFLCYKAKLATGNICTATAPSNAGNPCTTDEDCGGDAGSTIHCIPNKLPAGLVPSLGDQFDGFQGKDFIVKKLLSLCNPTDKNDEGRDDPDTHLTDYRIAPPKTSCKQDAPQNAYGACDDDEDCGGTAGSMTHCATTPKHEKQTNVRVDNQLGVLFVETTKVDALLVPASKDLVTTPPPPPDPIDHDVDHYKCYKVKVLKNRCENDPTIACNDDDDCAGDCNRGLPVGITASLTDQFNQPKLYQIKAAKRLCTPADKNGEGLQDGAAHLMCYQVAGGTQPKVCDNTSPTNVGGACKAEVDCGGTKGVTTHCVPGPAHTPVLSIRTNSQFGPALLDTIKAGELCVPSVKTPPGAPTTTTTGAATTTTTSTSTTTAPVTTTTTTMVPCGSPLYPVCNGSCPGATTCVPVKGDAPTPLVGCFCAPIDGQLNCVAGMNPACVGACGSGLACEINESTADCTGNCVPQ